MTNWYEPLNAKERRPYKLAVRKVMKAVGYTGSNQNLDSYADAFIGSDFGTMIHEGGWWNNKHMVKDRLLEFAATPAGNITKYGGKLEVQDETKTEQNIEEMYDKDSNSSNGMDYYRAEKIRNTGFFARVKNKVSDPTRRQGYGEALSNTISEGIGARVKMFKKSFDPMFLAKTLLGGGDFGRSVAVGLFGKNRSQSDVDYFAGKKQKKIRDTSSELPGVSLLGSPGGEASQVLTDMFEFMQVSRKEDLELYDTIDNFERLNEAQRESNHKELMNAIIGITGKKRKVDKKMDLDSKKRKVDEESRKKTGAKVKEEKEFVPKPVAEAGMSTPMKIGLGVAAATATAYGVSKLRHAMSGAESKGNYNLTFGDVTDKAGKITNPRGYITPESEYGKKLTDMTLAEVKEFGAKRNAKSKNSGAVGRYQFMPSTLFGKGGLVEESGLPMDTKFTPEVQEKLQDLLEKRNQKTLAAKGIPATDVNMYMAHYIGPGGVEAVLDSVRKGLDITVAQAMEKHNLTAPGRANNPELYQKKVWEFEDLLARRLAANMPKDEELTPAPATPAAPPVRPDVSKMSTENDDLWKSIKSKKQTVINYFGQNNTTIAQKSVMFNTGPVKREANPVTGL